MRIATITGKIIRAVKVQMSHAFSHGQVRIRLSGNVKPAFTIPAATMKNSGISNVVGFGLGTCMWTKEYCSGHIKSRRPFAHTY